MRHPNEMDLTTEDDRPKFEPMRARSLAELKPLARKFRAYEIQRKRQYDEIADNMRNK